MALNYTNEEFTLYRHKVTCTITTGGDLYYMSSSNKTYEGTDVIEWFNTVFNSGIVFSAYTKNEAADTKYRTVHNFIIDPAASTVVSCRIASADGTQDVREDSGTITEITSDELVE